MKNTILIVEDEGSLSGYLTKELQFEDFNVLVAANGLAAMETYQAHQNELLLILLDWMLPKLDGMEVLRRIRKHDQVPVIIMTARDYVGDKVAGLDNGADDYITKPFGNQELLARIRTALRHRRQPMETETKTPMYHADQLKIDFDKRRVFLGEEEVRLTQIEYKLVSLLAENAGKVITYESIIKDIWGPHADTNNRILRVNMANIRRKIEENPAVPKYVFTEVGVGYRMLENELNS